MTKPYIFEVIQAYEENNNESHETDNLIKLENELLC